MARKTGFTVVELVVVVILFAILAAAASPRFFETGDEADDPTVAAAYEGLRAGLSAFHARYIAAALSEADSPWREFDGLRTNANGYPFGTVDHHDFVNGNDCAVVFRHLMKGAAPSVSVAADAAAAAGAASEYVAVASAGPLCTYYHTGDGSEAGMLVRTLIYDPTSGEVDEGMAML